MALNIIKDGGMFRTWTCNLSCRFIDRGHLALCALRVSCRLPYCGWNGSCSLGVPGSSGVMSRATWTSVICERSCYSDGTLIASIGIS